MSRPIPRDSTILFMSAVPNDEAPLQIEKEVRGIREAIRDRFSLAIYPAAQPGDLIAAVSRERPSVIHFSGHGAGKVRRLFDEAWWQCRQSNHRLAVVLTCMTPWIAEKPWELVYDRRRDSFLATEAIDFTRNVQTPSPPDVISQRAGPLRILVAAAQPVGFGRLSIEQEIRVIQRVFPRQRRS